MNATAFDDISYVRRGYRQLFELGRGGMARVYLAESLASGVRKLVVLKILNAELSLDVEMRALFRREAEISAQMNHPNVVQVMEVVEYAESPVIVMEYLNGTSLSGLVKQAGRQLPLPLHMHILSQVLAGLHHFHELRDLEGASLCAVHRDVSPQNVMVLHDGPVKVLDFGIAKINAPNNHATRTGIIKGKIHYMPPEQLLGGADIDRRADIFAVGVMLWEAVAGRRLWEGKSEMQLVRQLATGAIPRLREFAPEVPDSVLEIVERATDVERDQRFASAHEMQAALEHALAREGWFVRPRELGEFMSQHFGESRRAQELMIQSALRTAPGVEGTLDCTRVGRLRHAPDHSESASPTARTADLPVPSAWHIRRRDVALGAGITLAASVALGSVWGLSRHPSAAVQAQQPSSSPPSVASGVLAPAAATEIAPAPVAATPAPLAPATETPAAPAPRSSAASVETTPPTSKVRSRNVSQATLRPAASSGSRSGKCNPPFAFSADGVKTYKPECF